LRPNDDRPAHLLGISAVGAEQVARTTAFVVRVFSAP
jgi:hypothetical protein